MREIKMKSISSGPDHVPRHIGKNYTVPQAEATALVNGGFAEFTTLHPPETAIIVPKEAEIIVPEETAEDKKPQKGRGKK